MGGGFTISTRGWPFFLARGVKVAAGCVREILCSFLLRGAWVGTYPRPTGRWPILLCREQVQEDVARTGGLFSYTTAKYCG